MSVSSSTDWIILLDLLQILSTLVSTHYSTSPPDTLLYLALPTKGMYPLGHSGICEGGKAWLLKEKGTQSPLRLSLSKKKCVCIVWRERERERPGQDSSVRDPMPSSGADQ